MKAIIIIIALLNVTNTALLAQDVRLNLYSAYVFDDYFEAYADSYNYFHGTIEGGYQWGAGVEYALHDAFALELVYHRQDTHAPTTWQNGQLTSDFSDLDFDVNYIMLAGNRLLSKANGKLEAYGGLMLGVGIADVSNEKASVSDSVTKFSWGGRLGCNVWVSEKIGIKIQALLLSAVQAAGGGVYLGTGGSGVGVTSYSTIYQFSLGGGLTCRLGKQSSHNLPQKSSTGYIEYSRIHN